MFRVILVLLAIISLSLACQEGESLCDHGDFGSCGNACCKLTFAVPLVTEKTMAQLNATLHTGGPDQLYSAQPTAEGTSGFADLRPYSKPVDFIGQGFHKTTNGLYTDTINFTIAPVDGGSSSVINAFSLSQIGGAYGDDGQNYWNLVTLVQAAFEDAEPQNVDGSCPAPASA